ncbi:hypothetical protein CCM_09388 [Cordyceps militaris CM01]|uniref:Uncharacterized protein n=1 Tax=Cordyceps militaris (strain CM01) TaxID=983644 RepID=G3JUN0_CORMM|nr:uncharacterized protein CCM_09388 [Cordyceps militaris CM01]EGX87766.1 hypothetical protein CCM_09388 [Cordyceps militaris CM01]
MYKSNESNDAVQSKPANVDVRLFLQKTLHPLLAFKEPSIPESILIEYRATVVPLDFDTGAPRNGAPALLGLMDREALRRALDELKPWIAQDKYDYEAGDGTSPSRCHHNGYFLANIVAAYLQNNQDPRSHDTLQDRTCWQWGGGEGTDRYLHNYHDDYTWTPGSFFLNLLPSKPRETLPDPRKPHVIHHVIDSTPWKPGTLRTSEFKSIVFIAAANKLKAAYKDLDYFGVTVVSFFNWEVRIVQGLVNFKTRGVDIRVSPAQSFRDGFRNQDGSIDPRFLTLLAYNLGEVLPLAK